MSSEPEREKLPTKKPDKKSISVPVPSRMLNLGCVKVEFISILRTPN